jgi:hypothetical protein
VTPEYPEGVYHYYVTEEFPYIGRTWRGIPDPSFFKNGPGPGRRGEGAMPHRPPPPAFGPPPDFGFPPEHRRPPRNLHLSQR